ncbi:MAG: hypothetical protein E7773_09195 [Sphingomonas sp.]|uniref:hypothetical protein n=1 Tax=Sphingomonas sp. TaxID=28214 RepID=UPI0012128C6D|nr:hypothetical protein [Sphingomonas sp.]THD36098.1 MAG: hypothetical protein E7773_09195 [Sphingomonas sp.]
MDLIDRYLTAIRWNLPRAANADDVIAELRDLIASRVEDHEESLGRPLDDKEISALLRDFGHPLVVAARYGTQQSLIGPDLFPFYWFSLKVVLALSVVLLIVSGAGDVLFGGHPVRAFAQAFGGAWWSLLGNAGLVTLIFAVIERTGWLTDHLNRWSPDQLPDLSDFTVKTKPKSAWEAVFEIAFGIGFILWWVGLVPLPIAWSNVQGLTLIPDPIWTAMWGPILALMLARLAFNLVQWLRPRWKAVRIGLNVATTAGAIVTLALIYRAGHWVTASSATLPAIKVAEIERSTNLGIHYAIIVIGVIWLFQCAKEIWIVAMARR